MPTGRRCSTWRGGRGATTSSCTSARSAGSASRRWRRSATSTTSSGSAAIGTIHGKGATPAWTDDDGHPLLGLIPLNMAAPVLLTLGQRHASSRRSRRTAPAATRAGRRCCVSRLAACRPRGEAYLARSRDAAASGRPPASTCASSTIVPTYRRARSPTRPAAVREQIERFGLADVIGPIPPHGCHHGRRLR